MGAIHQALLALPVVGAGAGCALLADTPTSDLEFAHIGECLTGNDGDAISTWTDPSTAANDLISVAGNPIKKTNIINGHSVVRCNGDDSASFTSPIAVTNFTYLAVINPSSLAGQHTLICGPTGSLQVRLNASKINVLKTATADMGSSSTSLSTGTFYTIGVTYDGSTLRFYLNGVADGVVSVSQTFTANITKTWLNVVNGLELFSGDKAIQALWTAGLASGQMTNSGGGITDSARAYYGHY